MNTYETERFRLRLTRRSDAPAILENFSDPDIMKHYDMKVLSDLAAAETMLAQWERDIATGWRLRWAIVPKSEDKLIGSCGIHGIDRERGCGEIGYELSKKYWRQGILSEVFPVMLHHAFQEMRLKRLTARVGPENVASVRLLRKFGFRNRVLPQLAGWMTGASFKRRIYRLRRNEYLAASGLGNMHAAAPAEDRLGALDPRKSGS